MRIVLSALLSLMIVFNTMLAGYAIDADDVSTVETEITLGAEDNTEEDTADNEITADLEEDTDTEQALSDSETEDTEITKGSLSNFRVINTAEPSFTDVADDYWGRQGIFKAYSYGLMEGDGTGKFKPNSKMTLAEVMTLAYRIYDIYNGGTGKVPVSEGEIWWDQIYYLAKDAGLLNGVGGFDDINALDSIYTVRLQMAELFVNAFPESEFPAINNPLYAPNDITSAASRTMYVSGIMQGDEGGMREYSYITRAEIAVIANRLAGDKTVWTPIEYTYIIVDYPDDDEEDTEQADEPDFSVCLGRYETAYDPYYINKAINVELATSNINGTILQPGEEFSFNRVVGPREASTGFKNAKVIENNRYVDGMGGGICQVSTTLFNAVLKTNLTITERHYHTIHSSYVPWGYDATVAWGFLDFKFVNSGNHPILVAGYANGGKLVMSIWGNAEDYVEGVTTSISNVGMKYTLKRWVEGIGETFSTTSIYVR